MSDHDYDQDQDQEPQVDGIGLGDPTAGDQMGQSLHKMLTEGYPQHWKGLTPEEVAEDIKSTGEKLRADKISIEEWKTAEEKRKQILAAYVRADLPPPENIKNETPPTRRCRLGTHGQVR